MKLICHWGIFFLFAAILAIIVQLCDCMCGRAEYFINGECCPMCAAGSHVYWHCTADISTTCVPCTESTYTDIPSGLTTCFSCTVCDSGHGIRVKTACTRISDTVCEPLDGYYCTDQHTESCRRAEKHTNCSPGQYIKHRGTSLTECAECSEGTFSNGSLQICQPHSKCEDLGLTERKPGTLSSDAECGDKSPAALTAGITVIFVLVVTAAVIIFLKIKHKTVKRAAEDDHTSQATELQEDVVRFNTNCSPGQYIKHRVSAEDDHTSQATELQEDVAAQTTVTPMITTKM